MKKLPGETLKQYLVKLGWDIDSLGLAKANKAIGDFGTKIAGLGLKLVNSFVSASTAVVGFSIDANRAVLDLMKNVADADLSVERFARRMWTSKENARNFTNALDAMGASMEDIYYMTPEEFEYFMELRDFGSQLKAPDELQNTLKLIRSIGQEVNKLKVIFSNATQWVVYYLGKFMGKDLQDMKSFFQSINNWLAEHLPQITEKIANFLYILYRLGKTIFQVFTTVIDLFSRLFSSLEAGQRKVIGLAAGFVSLLTMGPIGVFIAALLGLLLLLDDFFVWQKGGKSVLGDTWQSLTTMFSHIDTSGLEEVKNKFGQIGEKFDAIGKKFYELSQKFLKWADEVGLVQKMFDALMQTLELIADILDFILSGIMAITGDVYSLEEGNPWRLNDEAQYNYLNAMSGGRLPEYDDYVAYSTGKVNTLYVNEKYPTLTDNSHNTINVYQQPGESSEDFAKRLTEMMTEQRRNFNPFG